MKLIYKSWKAALGKNISEKNHWLKSPCANKFWIPPRIRGVRLGTFMPVPRYHDSLEEFQGGIILIDFVESGLFFPTEHLYSFRIVGRQLTLILLSAATARTVTNKKNIMSTIKKTLKHTKTMLSFSSVGYYVSDFYSFRSWFHI